MLTFVAFVTRIHSLGESAMAAALLAQDATPTGADFSTLLVTLVGTSPLAAVCFYGWWQAEKKASAMSDKYDAMVERLFKLIDQLSPLVSASTTTLHEVQDALTEAARYASQRQTAEGTEKQLDELIRRLEKARGDER